MKLNVGDYVRTKDGIIGKIKIEDYTYSERWIIDTLWYDYDKDDWSTTVMQWDIVKSSPNIIDLIEVGDYVNGRKIERKYFCKVNQKWIVAEDCGDDYYDCEFANENIKSVVTKEQFEQMEYEVEK